MTIIAGLLVAPLVGWAVAQLGPPLLLVVAAMVAAVVLVRWPVLGIYALVAGTFFDELYLPAGFAKLGAADIAVFGLIPAWLSHRLLRPSGIRWPAATPLLAGYLALAFASLMLGVSPGSARGNYMRLLTYAVAVLALVDLTRREAILEAVTRTMAFCGLIHAVFSLADLGDARRLMGLSDQPNILGVRVALGAIPAAGLWQRARDPRIRWAWAAALAIMLVAIALTISRGTYVALTAAFIWWMRRSPRLAVAMAVVAGLTWIGLGRFAEDRAARIEQRLDFDDSSVTNRGVVARNALKVVVERPLLGVGFGQFRDLDKVIDITHQGGRGSHNFYLGVAASTGVPALLLLMGFVGVQLRGIRRPTGPPPSQTLMWLITVWQAVAVYHCVSLLVRGGLRLTDWTLFGLYAALAAVIAHRARAES